MPGSDNEILKLWAASRNADAFAELVRRYAPLVYSAALRVLGNSADAEDVTQLCFLELAQRPPAIRSTLAGWLHRLATHRALNHLRGERRRVEREAAFEVTRAAADGEAWEPIADAIDEAIAALKPGIQEVIVRRFFLGESPDDVAQALGIAKRTVRHRQQQGVDAIRESLKRKNLVMGMSLAALLAANLRASAVVLPDSLYLQLGKLALSGIRPLRHPGVLSWLSTVRSANVVLTVGTSAVLIAGLLGAIFTRHTLQSGAQFYTDLVAAPASSSSPILSIVPPQEKAAVTSTDDAIASMSNIVLSVCDTDGKPVSGAMIGISGKEGVLARTDADGVARLVSFPKGTMGLHLRAWEYDDQFCDVIPRLRHTPLHLQCVMNKSLPLSLHVYSNTGKPLEGVDVLRKDGHKLVGRTGTDGTVQIPFGPHLLVLRHPEYGEQALWSQKRNGMDGTDPFVYLQRPAAATIRTLWNDMPVQGATVICTNHAQRAELTSDAEGEVRVANLVAESEYFFQAQLPQDHGTALFASKLVYLGVGEDRNITLALRPPPTVAEGTVRWEDGTPFGRGKLIVSTISQRFQTTVDVDGHFLAPLFSDLNTLSLNDLPAYASQKERLQLRGSVRTPLLRQDIILARKDAEAELEELSIALDFMGREVPVELTILGNSDMICTFATPNDLQLRIEQPRKGNAASFVIVDRQSGYAGLWFGPAPNSPGGTRIRLEIPVGILHGTMRDQHGTPVPYASVSITLDGWHNSRSVQADKEGHFKVWPMPLRTRFHVNAGAFNHMRINEARVFHQSEEEMSFILRRLDTKVTGRVRYDDGSPVTQGIVSCEDTLHENTISFAIAEGRFIGELIPGVWTMTASDGISSAPAIDVAIPKGEIVIRFEDSPETADTKLTERERQTKEMVIQLGRVFRAHASDQESAVFPPLSKTFGRFAPEMESLFPEYVTDTLLLDRLSGEGEEKFCYFGYTVEDEASVMAFLDAYDSVGPEGIEGIGSDKLSSTPPPGGTPSSAFHRLQEAESGTGVPVLWQVPDPDTGTGGWVLYMDGHTEWKHYPGDFPMTEAVIRRLRALQDEAME